MRTSRILFLASVVIFVLLIGFNLESTKLGDILTGSIFGFLSSSLLVWFLELELNESEDKNA